jgi:hypothetical protein
MKFKQSYTIYESDFGSREVIVVISDSYSDLFTATDGNLVSNIQIKNVKQELNIEENSFAIDSFQFTIRETSSITENEKNCLSFVLHASDLKRFRFIGVFFDSVSADNKLFAGQISSKISGDDIYYTSSIWSIEGTQREYSFTALSFDISILEKVSFNSNIEKEDGTFVSGVYERIDADANFIDYCGFSSKASFFLANRTYFTYPIAPIYNVIRAYLAKAGDILTELLGYSVPLVLEESVLDFKVNTMAYDFTSNINYHTYCTAEQIVSTTKYNAEIKLDDGLWIHRGFIRSSLTGHKNADYETDMSFEQFDNIAEFLSSIAKSLGCFVRITETAGCYYFKFVSRGSMVESDETSLIGFKEGSIDTSSVLVKEGNEYFSKSTYWTADGVDLLDIDRDKHETSEKLEKIGNKIAEAEKKKTEFVRLLFSTAPVLRAKWYYAGEVILMIPINVLNGHDTLIEAYTNASYEPIFYNTLEVEEVLTTTLYIKNQEVPKGTWTNVYRPAYNISVNVNNTEYEFNTITDYVNFLIGREKQYYETERNLTIPYWNGFRKDSVDSWKNLKLGAKFNETINVRDYTGGVWSESTITKTYIITSIEWSLEKPEVKIKGQLSEKFSFITPSATTALVESFSADPKTGAELSDDIVSGVAYSDITKYQAVSMLSNGQFVPSTPALYATLAGIALSDALAGENFYYQINGNINNDFGFTNIGFELRVDTGLATDWNYIDDWSGFDNTDYKLLTVGRVLTESSFKITLNEYILNEPI